MPFTSHGHAYGLVNADEPRPALVGRCGGPPMCTQCAREAAHRCEPAELTEAQRLAEQIIRGRHCDPGAYVEERPGMEELTDAEFDALYAEVLRLLETATVTVSWEQDGEQPTTPNA